MQRVERRLRGSLMLPPALRRAGRPPCQQPAGAFGKRGPAAGAEVEPGPDERRIVGVGAALEAEAAATSPSIARFSREHHALEPLDPVGARHSR